MVSAAVLRGPSLLAAALSPLFVTGLLLKARAAPRRSAPPRGKSRCGGASSGLSATALPGQVSGVPMLERIAKRRWGDDPAYHAYVARTRCLLPLPWPKSPVEEGSEALLGLSGSGATLQAAAPAAATAAAAAAR